MPYEMSPRERVLTALRRQRPDRIPKTFGLTSALVETCKQKIGTSDYENYFELEPRWAGTNGTKSKNDFSRYYTDRPDIKDVSEWGVGYESAHFYHFSNMVHPLRNTAAAQEVRDYPWPDVLADYRWEGIESKVKAVQDEGYPVEVGIPGGSPFETAWSLRGQAQLMMDFHDNQEFAAALLDVLETFAVEAAARMAAAGADILVTGDDVGWQQSMMMSPAMWRQWLKPRLARIWQSAKKVKPDILIYYHSDGFIEPIIPDLIEIGLDILNPVQPECMDPVEIKQLYGDRLAFWGTIGVQSTMPWGTPAEVRTVVKERIETVGPEGLLVAPTHVLEPEVPWENIVAFVEAVHEYGAVGR
jgi:uroporphyrinogen decarboxylase